MCSHCRFPRPAWFTLVRPIVQVCEACMASKYGNVMNAYLANELRRIECINGACSQCNGVVLHRASRKKTAVARSKWLHTGIECRKLL